MVYCNEVGGRKFDQNKNMWELLPPEAMEALAELYTVGAKKYQARNWELGMPWGRIFGALMRHAWAWFRGQRNDPEAGTHHMIAVAWNALTLYTYEIRKTGTDDRPKAAAYIDLGGPEPDNVQTVLPLQTAVS